MFLFALIDSFIHSFIHSPLSLSFFLSFSVDSADCSDLTRSPSSTTDCPAGKSTSFARATAISSRPPISVPTISNGGFSSLPRDLPRCSAIWPRVSAYLPAGISTLDDEAGVSLRGRTKRLPGSFRIREDGFFRGKRSACRGDFALRDRPFP